MHICSKAKNCFWIALRNHIEAGACQNSRTCWWLRCGSPTGSTEPALEALQQSWRGLHGATFSGRELAELHVYV